MRLVHKQNMEFNQQDYEINDYFAVVSNAAIIVFEKIGKVQ